MVKTNYIYYFVKRHGISVKISHCKTRSESIKYLQKIISNDYVLIYISCYKKYRTINRGAIQKIFF